MQRGVRWHLAKIAALWGLLALQVLLYNFADLRLVHTIETLSNPTGIMALSPSADHTVLACPGTHTGQVRAQAERQVVLLAALAALESVASGGRARGVAWAAYSNRVHLVACCLGETTKHPPTARIERLRMLMARIWCPARCCRCCAPPPLFGKCGAPLRPCSALPAQP